MSKSSATTSIPSSLSTYKPQILKIKLNYFRPWIQKRLTVLLEGLEDEILWDLVFNYLEDAQKRARREGPAANPSGGLNYLEIQTALTGFLGLNQSLIFVTELFSLLQSAEKSDNGIPMEFGLNPHEAERAAFNIIDRKKKEVIEMSERVRREIRHNDNYNQRGGSYRRTEDDRNIDRERGHGNRYRDRYREYNDNDSRSYRSRSRSRSRSPSNRRQRYYSPVKSGRERSRSRSRYHSNDRYHDSDDRNRTYRPTHDTRTKPQLSSPPRINSSSSSGTDSPSRAEDTWEPRESVSLPNAPRAPNIQENVSNELKMALRAKALKSLVEKSRDK